MGLKTIIILSSIVTTCILFEGCTKIVAPDECEQLGCNIQQVSYTNDIKPLITTYCATNLGPGTGCHDAWIFDYAQVKASIESGYFEKVITNKTMPKIPNTFGITEMNDTEINTFRCWICDGYPEN